MAAYVINSPDPDFPDGDRGSEVNVCVPFVPWVCPRCGHRKCRTYGHRGRVRLHQCRAPSCRLRFRSIELPPERLDVLTEFGGNA